MIITKKALSRRTVLRGLGATLALPLLDGMVPAFAALRTTAAKPVQRLGVVYVPNGIFMKHWTPAAEGAAFEFTPILKALEPFRDRLLVLSGLHSGAGREEPVHGRASTRFLTGMFPKRTAGSDVEAGISMDQLVAKQLGQHTQLASLELGLDSMDFGGSCDKGYSCSYTNTIAWSSATTPLPLEINPRAVFERLFGDTQSTETAARLARIKKDRSILDSVIQEVNHLQGELGPGDRGKLTQYLDAVRDVERRIQKAEEQSAQELPLVDQPMGVPGTFDEHAKLMYDLQVLAYQCDLTRVATFMIGREYSGRTYPELGVPDAHHPISHHRDDPDNLAKLLKINTYHVTLFANYLEKLRSTPDGDGSLLDHMTIIYGAGMSDGNGHSPENLPILLLGGGSGHLKGGRHLRYRDDTPLANLNVTLLDQFGIRRPLGDSTGEFQDLSF